MRLRLTALLLLGAALACVSPALAQTKQECAAAYEQTQILRNQGKLTEARAQALTCSAATCSVHATADCVRWLSEIDTAMPTVVVATIDASGVETLAVRVVIEDRGPGIPDIGLAMQEGWSTATAEMRARGFGAGMGLPNIKRSTDHFELTSTPGQGTTLFARVPL